MTILSLLMATTPDRAEMFSSLYNEVMKQITYMDTVHPTLGKIEVVIDDSKRFLDGGMSIGEKREALVKRAEGKYLCFLDSDESIAPNYVETLVRLAQSNCDVLTFRNISKMDNFWMIVDMSLRHTENMQATPYYTIKRLPWHICPVRSLFAKQFNFSYENYGEDWGWFSQVLTLCKTEAKSDSVIHQYNHGKHSEADKITEHGILAK